MGNLRFDMGGIAMTADILQGKWFITEQWLDGHAHIARREYRYWTGEGWDDDPRNAKLFDSEPEMASYLASRFPPVPAQ